MPDLLFPVLQEEPLRKNRWILRFPNDVGVQPFMLSKCDSPKANTNTVEMPFINTSVFYPGRFKWLTQNITIRDFIAPSSSQALIEWFRLHHESPTGRSGYIVGAAKNLILELLDPTGVKVKEWLMENCILSGDVDFGGLLDYSDDAILELSFTVQPQKCIQLY